MSQIEYESKGYCKRHEQQTKGMNLACFVSTKDFQTYLAQCNDSRGLMQDDLLSNRLAINDCRFIFDTIYV